MEDYHEEADKPPLTVKTQSVKIRVSGRQSNVVRIMEGIGFSLFPFGFPGVLPYRKRRG